MDNHSTSPNQEKTKICPICGIRKLLSDFLINPLDHIKQYDALCNACRNRGTRPWEKKLSKDESTDGGEEGGSGGKAHQHNISYYAKLLSKQLQELNNVQAEFEKQLYREEIDQVNQDKLTKVIKEKSAKEKTRSISKEKPAKAATTSSSKKTESHTKKTFVIPPLSAAQKQKGFFIPNQTGAVTPWADIFRWFANYSAMMHNPGIMLYHLAVQIAFLTRFNPLLKLMSNNTAPNNTILNKTYFQPSNEKNSLFSQTLTNISAESTKAFDLIRNPQPKTSHS